MDDQEIVVASTSDTQDAVNAAAGVERQPEAEKTEEIPETKASSKEAEKPEGEKKGGFQKRIDKLTARNYRLEEELAELREKLAAATKPAEASKPPAASDKPKPETFETYEDYVEALADWKTEQKLTKAKEVEAAAAEHQRVQEVFSAYNKRVATAHERYDDFDEVVGQKNMQIPEAVQLAVIEMENGPDVAYYLGKHPDLCEELVAMSPLQGVMRVGRISAELGAESAPAPKPKVGTNAPPPLKPVGGGQHKSSVPLDELPYQEYRRIREEAIRARR